MQLKTLDIDWIDLEIAFRDTASGMRSYIDLVSGEVIAVGSEPDPRQRELDRDPDRYLEVPLYSSDQGVEVLRTFVTDLVAGVERQRLNSALETDAPLRRCEEVLAENALLYERFCLYEEQIIFERLLLWLVSMGVCTRDVPPTMVQSGPLLSLLLQAA